MSRIPVIELGTGGHAELARRHAAAWGPQAAALFGVRWRLTRKRSAVASVEALVELARAHVDELERFHPGLAEEHAVLAAESGLEQWQLVILNHYTDFRDIRPGESAAGDGGCSVVYVPGPDGPLVAQTWDMHGTAEPFVGVLRLDPPGGPAAAVFTIAGCLGMCGVNAAGVAVCINNLTPDDARVGVLWPALVRVMLEQTSAADAWAVLREAKLGSGHNYLVADARQVLNVETTGVEKRVTHTDLAQPYWHTNHYLHPELEPLQVPLVPASTSRERYALMTRRFDADPPTDAEQLWALLGSHEGAPRSICSHLRGDDPSASRTCGAVLIDPVRVEMRAHQGCLHSGESALVRP